MDYLPYLIIINTYCSSGLSQYKDYLASRVKSSGQMDEENTRLPLSVVPETSEAGGDGASVWEDMALPRGGASTAEPPRRKDRRWLRSRSEGAAPPEPKRATGAATWRAARAKPRETRRRDAIDGGRIGGGWIVFFSPERRGLLPLLYRIPVRVSGAAQLQKSLVRSSRPIRTFIDYR